MKSDLTFMELCLQYFGIVIFVEGLVWFAISRASQQDWAAVVAALAGLFWILRFIVAVTEKGK